MSNKLKEWHTGKGTNESDMSDSFGSGIRNSECRILRDYLYSSDMSETEEDDPKNFPRSL